LYETFTVIFADLFGKATDARVNTVDVVATAASMKRFNTIIAAKGRRVHRIDATAHTSISIIL